MLFTIVADRKMRIPTDRDRRFRRIVTEISDLA
jgi:hypothetical protein